MVVVFDFDFDFVFVTFVLVLEITEGLTEGVIEATVIREGSTTVETVLLLVLALIITNVDVLERKAESLVDVSIVYFVLLVLVDCFRVLLVDAEFGMLDAVEDLEPTELVEAGDPLREDEEEGRWYW